MISLRKLGGTVLKSSVQSCIRNYETVSIKTIAKHVRSVELNRPEKLNAMNSVFWREIRECFQELDQESDCRAIILSGNGRVFTAGLDLSDAGALTNIFQAPGDVARKGKDLYRVIRSYQDSFTALEKCTKPVLAVIHSACVGGGVNMVASADIRYCTNDAWFQIKETAIGLAADVGALQRMPKIIGSGLVRELAYTARKMYADEAKESGFVTRVFPDKTSMLDAALQVAERIAALSPVAVQGSKIHINYSLDHTTDEALEYIARWNSLHLQSEDLLKAIMAQMNKSSKVDFDNY